MHRRHLLASLASIAAVTRCRKASKSFEVTTLTGWSNFTVTW